MSPKEVGIGFNLGEEECESGADFVEVEFLLVSKVGNPKSATKIHRLERRARSVCYAARNCQAVPVLADESIGVKNLRAGKEMNAPEVEGGIGENCVQNLIQTFFVDSKWRRTPAHAHRTALGFSRWIHTNCDIGRNR